MVSDRSNSLAYVNILVKLFTPNTYKGVGFLLSIIILAGSEGTYAYAMGRSELLENACNNTAPTSYA